MVDLATGLALDKNIAAPDTAALTFTVSDPAVEIDRDVGVDCHGALPPFDLTNI